MTQENSPSEALFDVYHALRAPRRRYVIQILLESDEEAHMVRTLARQIAAIEEDIPPENATGEPYRNVYNSLSQTHLGTLSDAGIIVYDPNRQTVTTGENFRIAILIVVLNRSIYQILHEETLPDMDDLKL